MRIVLDTNVFVSDFWMRGADFQMLLSDHLLAGHKLFVPEIVMDEVRQKYREHLRKVKAEFDKAQLALSRILPKDVKHTVPAVDRAPETFDEEFADTLRAAGAQPLPYSRTTHADFARRAIEKKHPFDDRGAGYRDALVWDAVLSLARARGDGVAFVTQDIGDFLKKSGDVVELHPDLAAEVVRATRAPDRVRPFHTLNKFVVGEIQPRLKELGELRDSIQQDGRVGKIDIRAALLERLKADLEHTYINPQWLGLPQGTEHASVAEVTAVHRIDVRDVRRLSDARLVLTVTAAIEMRFFTAYPEVVPFETALVEDYADTSSVPTRWDDSDEGAFTAEMRVLINKARSRITSVQIRALDPAV